MSQIDPTGENTSGLPKAVKIIVPIMLVLGALSCCCCGGLVALVVWLDSTDVTEYDQIAKIDDDVFLPGDPTFDRQSTSLPVYLGDSKTTVHDVLGADPDRSGADFESYFSHGIVVKYAADDTVGQIEATWFTTGEHFRGHIFDISLSDPRDRYVAILDEPDELLPWADYSLAKWDGFRYRIVMEVWDEDGRQDPWGAYRAGDVKQIAIMTFDFDYP